MCKENIAKNVVFLDYDGVVNTPIWSDDGEVCRFNYPSDNKVNNFQAVQWVSEFCKEFGYSIVVTSTWRLSKNYKECLINGGLRKGIEILGRTESIANASRGKEIKKYLDAHPEIEKFLIFDDEEDVDGLSSHLVLCSVENGFGMNEYGKASEMHKDYNEKVIGGENIEYEQLTLFDMLDNE